MTRDVWCVAAHLEPRIVEWYPDQAVAQARHNELVRAGRLDVCLIGGTEAAIRQNHSRYFEQTAERDEP